MKPLIRQTLRDIEWSEDAQKMGVPYNPVFEIWPRVRRSGYEHLVLATTVNLMERGWITTINHEPDHFIAGLRDSDETGGSPLAYIVFEPKPNQELAHVIMGDTQPDFRRCGLYSVLFKQLAMEIQGELNPGCLPADWALIKKITGCYHIDNLSARAMNKSLGRRDVRVTTEYGL